MPGFSIFTTSAPSQARASVQDGPASNWVKSTTRTPARKSNVATLSDMVRSSLFASLAQRRADSKPCFGVRSRCRSARKAVDQVDSAGGAPDGADLQAD